MKDLKKAIYDLFVSSFEIKGLTSDTSVHYAVREKDWKVLLAEYNIHFVEPDEPQLGGAGWGMALNCLAIMFGRFFLGQARFYPSYWYQRTYGDGPPAT